MKISSESDLWDQLFSKYTLSRTIKWTLEQYLWGYELEQDTRMLLQKWLELVELGTHYLDYKVEGLDLTRWETLGDERVSDCFRAYVRALGLANYKDRQRFWMEACRSLEGGRVQVPLGLREKALLGVRLIDHYRIRAALIETLVRRPRGTLLARRIANDLCNQRL